jgi:hypothetical protein
MHSTAILAKHSIEDVLTAHPEIAQQYPILNDVLYYFRHVLEHTVNTDFFYKNLLFIL